MARPQVLLPLTFSRAPAPLKPAPLRVRGSEVTLRPVPWTCRLAPATTTVPAAPSARVSTVTVVPLVPTPVICGWSVPAKLTPLKVTVKTLPDFVTVTAGGTADRVGRLFRAFCTSRAVELPARGLVVAPLKVRVNVPVRAPPTVIVCTSEEAAVTTPRALLSRTLRAPA